MLTEEQMKKLLAHLGKLIPRDRLLLKVAIAGNLRPCELFGLNPEDRVGNELHLRRTVVAGGNLQEGITKTRDKDTKRVALPPGLAEELDDYIKNDLATPHILFPNMDGRRLEKSNYGSRVIASLRKALGLKTLNLRMLRRSSATLQMRHGSVKDVPGQMRHTSPTTTLAVYAQIIPEGQKAMVSSYWESLTGVPAGVPPGAPKKAAKKSSERRANLGHP